MTVDNVMTRWPSTIRVFLDFSCVASAARSRRSIRSTRPAASTASIPARFMERLRERHRLRRKARLGRRKRVRSSASPNSRADRAARCAGVRLRPGPALPRAEGAADRVQRRAGHFGDILPADRKVDLDAALRPCARPAWQAATARARRAARPAAWTSRARAYGYPAAGVPTVCSAFAASAGKFRRSAAATRPMASTARYCRSTATAVAGYCCRPSAIATPKISPGET